ncbi:MAG: hypothetical protein LN417_01215, partial [Candidatus Thermoplasmatota archaeon]|nr:hypothetical protein [Candidatus Thermoplasmatota archaeon]
TLVNPFQSGFFVRVRKEQDKRGGPPGKRKEPPSDDKGSDRERPSHLALPNIVDVRKTTWEEYDFDRESSLKVRYGGEESGYDFYINMDNIHLQTEIKGRPRVDPQLLEAQYKYGVVLVGLAILNEYEKAEDKDEEEDVYENIRFVTQAISPFLLPMISSLGDIEATS